MKKICSLFLACLFINAAQAQGNTKTVLFENGKLSINIPADQDTMSSANIQAKYHRNPDGKTKYFSNSDFTFSIVLNELMPNKVTEAGMMQHKDDLVQQIQSKFELTENDVITVNGHKLIVVSFTSEVPSGKIFNRRFMAVADNKLVMVSYNTTEDDLENRKAQIESSIRSVQVK
ncbi:MAG: hypothetical protein U0V75_15580 [Ferruginibacter sp.]